MPTSGSPSGISPTTATPSAERSKVATITIPTATTTSAPGTRGTAAFEHEQQHQGTEADGDSEPLPLVDVPNRVDEFGDRRVALDLHTEEAIELFDDDRDREAGDERLEHRSGDEFTIQPSRSTPAAIKSTPVVIASHGGEPRRHRHRPGTRPRSTRTAPRPPTRGPRPGSTFLQWRRRRRRPRGLRRDRPRRARRPHRRSPGTPGRGGQRARGHDQVRGEVGSRRVPRQPANDRDHRTHRSARALQQRLVRCFAGHRGRRRLTRGRCRPNKRNPMLPVRPSGLLALQAPTR